MDDLVIKTLFAVLVGALVGYEREIHTGIGLRTLTLICLGSTLFTIYCSNVSQMPAKPWLIPCWFPNKNQGTKSFSPLCKKMA